MRKILLSFVSTVLLLTILSGSLSVFASTAYDSTVKSVSVSAQSCILLGENGEILYAKDEHKHLPMASTTKLMTALVCLEHLDPDRLVTVDERAVGTEGSSAYLRSGELLPVSDLLNALLLQSANDAAVALALAVSPTLEEFADLMNERAGLLGLEDTHFMNPHGLDAEEHYSSAFDLARIMQACLADPLLADVLQTKTYTCKSDLGNLRTFVNHNRLLWDYPACIGGKTGYTKADGRCLVSAAEKDGVILTAVTLNAPNDWEDHKALFSYGFSRFENVLLCEKDTFSTELDVVASDKSTVPCTNEGDLSVSVLTGTDPKITVETEHFLYAPVKAGDTVGRLCVYQNGKMIASTSIVASGDADLVIRKMTFSERIKNIFGAVKRFFKSLFARG